MIKRIDRLILSLDKGYLLRRLNNVLGFLLYFLTVSRWRPLIKNFDRISGLGFLNRRSKAVPSKLRTRSHPRQHFESTKDIAIRGQNRKYSKKIIVDGERLRGSQALIGLHLRTHQAISGLEGTLSVGGGLLTGHSFLSLVIEIAEDWRSKKYGLGDGGIIVSYLL